jgi:hypothetical protein
MKIIESFENQVDEYNIRVDIQKYLRADDKKIKYVAQQLSPNDAE